jgi:hypothetical protein
MPFAHHAFQDVDMEERRKLPRKYLMFYARVFDRSSGRLMGNLADITTQGAMIISEDPIEIGVTYRLRLDLPDGFNFDREHLDFEARSLWWQPDVDTRFFTTGFQLLGLGPSDAQIIDQINTAYGLRD